MIFFQIKKICPYYFDLQEVFCARAGMIPKSRTDKLFGTGSSGQDEDVDVEKDIEFMDSTSHDEVSSAAKSRTSSTKKVKPQSKERSVRRGKVLYPEDDQFNKFMSMVMKNNATKTKEEDKELQDTMRISKLMTAFKDAKEAMGGPIKAAYHCPAFVQFLDKSEKRELAAYKAEQEEEDSEEG